MSRILKGLLKSSKWYLQPLGPYVLDNRTDKLVSPKRFCSNETHFPPLQFPPQFQLNWITQRTNQYVAPKKKHNIMLCSMKQMIKEWDIDMAEFFFCYKQQHNHIPQKSNFREYGSMRDGMTNFHKIQQQKKKNYAKISFSHSHWSKMLYLKEFTHFNNTYTNF